MKNNKWKLLYFIGILIGIIILMLSYTPRIKTIELFGLSKFINNKSNSNSIVGGTIITLQLDFTTLLTQFDILEKNIENSYSIKDLSGNIKDLSGNTPTVAKLYSTIQNIKTGMNGLLETEILQPAPTSSTPTVSSKQTISNKTIKTDPRWEVDIKPLLTELKKNFGNLSTYVKEYLASMPDPLPPNVTKDQRSIINILTNMQLTVKTIDEYITDILK